MSSTNFSSNEIYNLSYRAIAGTRQERYAAQEGAMSAVFLAQIGLDGVKAVVEALDHATTMTTTLKEGIAAIDKLLCGETRQEKLPNLDAPLLLWGMCCVASRETDILLAIEDSEDNNQPLIAPERAAKILLPGKDVTLFLLDNLIKEKGRDYPPAVKKLRATTTGFHSLERAKQLAHKTYVPSTKTSHQYGAGSTKSDND